MNEAIFEDLSKRIAGDVFTDEISRCLYATDASVYEELPKAIIRPKNKNDCIEAVKFANENGVALIPRAAGTSIAGQCVGNGVVVDISRYMTEIVSDIEENSIRVQPGVILDDLNDQIKSKGLRFAPDISTSDRCMIGGMIGNNAAGSHSILYGTTRDHVIELEVILSDGSLVTFGPISEQELSEKRKLENKEGEIYRTLYQIIDKNRAKILDAFPKPEIIRRNTGYPLDYLANSQPWNAKGPAFNLAPFMCGTEGTLAFITEAKLRLIPVVQDQRLVCTHFTNLMEAMHSVSSFLRFEPAAIELIDKRILDLAKGNIEQQKNRFWIEGDPSAVLITEFHGNENSVEQKVEDFLAWLEEEQVGYSHTIIKGSDINRVWGVRKAGLGLLMGMEQEKKPVAVIEDAAVSPDDLPKYVADIISLMKSYDTDCVYYGHASVGLLHLRPELNLSNPSDKEKFKKIAEEVAELVTKYNGALSGEHGDGRVRAPYLKKQLGAEVYDLIREVKNIFDPKGLFNPGKIISTISIDSNLRGNRNKANEFVPQFNWHRDLGLSNAIEKCNGVGACRKSVGRGIMCPSYMASKEEKFSTRGRSNVLRYVTNSNNPRELISNPQFKEILDTCLGCKGCKSECPSNVDMARLKSEFLYQYYKVSGKSLEVLFAQYHGKFLRLAAIFPRIANLLLQSRQLVRMLGLARETTLPLLAKRICSKKWYRKQISDNGRPHVILLIDIYTRFFEPEIGQAAISVLRKSGYDIFPIVLDESPRLFISYGLLPEAKKALVKLVNKLGSFNEIPIVGLEPSELLTLKDEVVDLVGPDVRSKVESISKQSYLFEEFFEQIKSDKKISEQDFDKQNKKYLIHVHCHQKTLAGTDSSLNAINGLPGATAEVINAGCCGMAGSFGYKHQALSKKIANMSLVPAINVKQSKMTVVATGFSCRHQVYRETGVRAYHPANIIALAMTK